jgi:hypothetical protein
MKSRLLFLTVFLGAMVVALNDGLAQGTAFTYQGRLNNGGNPVNGLYDLNFSLFTTSNGIGQVGATVTNTATPVSNGLFSVLLNFGPGIFTGADLWLQIGVRTNNGGAFSPLNPLQAITPTPYAIFATGASNLSGTLPASQLTGSLPSGLLGGTFGNPVTFNNGANTFDGSFYGQFFGSSFIGGNFVGNFIGTGNGLGDVWHTAGNLGTPPGTTFLGTLDNQPLILKVNGQRAMRFEPTTDTPNVVGGYAGNFVQPGLEGVTIGGGGTVIPYNGKPQPNTVTNNGHYGTIAGGYDNVIAGYGGAILGGSANIAGGDFAVIGGGQFHTNSGDHSFIGGGLNNAIGPNFYSSVVGGFNNIINSNAGAATVVGGGYNVIQTNGNYSFIGAGYGNIMSGYLGAIVGGWGNTEASYGGIIGGGLFNDIQTNSAYAFIGGGYQNTLQTLSGYSVIGGGYLNAIQTNSGYSVIAGGLLNTIQDNADQSVIAGGNANSIQTSARESFIGGGFANSVQPGAFTSFIGGGYHNTNQAAAGVIVGGNNNFIQTNAFDSFIGGGVANVAAGGLSTAVGGQGNSASANNSTVVGGLFNTNQGVLGFIGGGYFNTVSGWAAVIAGGESNRATGAYSMAAGYHANALQDGTFVWADFTPGNFSSTRTNQFLIRAQNGVGINTNNPQSALHVNGVVTASGFAGDGSSLVGLNASQLTTGTLPGGDLAGTYSNPLTFNNPANSFTGNGAGLANVNAATLGGLASSSFWSTTGNAGTTPGANFIGTTDNQRLLIRGSFVGIGRTSTISPAEYFGIDAPASSNNYGGMYISATNVNAKPFYGYSLVGGQSAWHYLDGADSYKWKLNVGGNDRIVVTPAGNVGIGNTGPTNLLMVNFARCDGSTWINASDRNLKDNFIPISATEILAKVVQLPIAQWNYKSDANTAHLGPVAQDFRAAFGLGADDKSIATVDEGGVALAAIQGLNQKLEDQSEALKIKDARIHALESRLADLEKIVDRIASHSLPDAERRGTRSRN